MSVGQHETRVHINLSPTQTRMLIDLVTQGLEFYENHPSHPDAVKNLYRVKGGIVLGKLKARLENYS